MGRLQRKKSEDKKKKAKSSGAAGDDAQSSPDDTVQKSGVISRSSGEIKKRPASSGIKPAGVKLEKNFIEKALQFLREVKIELKKVTWPSRKQTIGSTVVVIILVIIISLFLGIVDIGLSSLIRMVLQ